MNFPIADAAPVTDLLDVFNSYDGSVIFRGLTESVGGQPAVLGTVGWIFTGFGALFVLWGFVLRTRGPGGEGKMGEIAKTWIVIAFMVGGRSSCEPPCNAPTRSTRRRPAARRT